MPNLKQLTLIATVSSLGVFAGSLIAPIEVRYIESITGNPVLTGSVFGVGSVFFVILSVYVGRLSDRVGRKRVILTGLVVGALYAVLYSLVFNIFQLYGVKFAWALSALATGPVLAAYLQDFLEPYKNKGRYFGYVYSAQSISGSAGALLGGYVAETFGLTAPFLILTGVYIVMFLLAWLVLPETMAGEDDVEAGLTTPPRLSLLETFKFVLTKPELLFYLSLNTSYGINWGIKAFIWPLAIFAIAKSDLITGSIFATMGVVAFCLLPFAGRVVDRYGPFRVSFFQFLLLGSTGVGLALTDQIAWFWVLAAVYTVGEVLNVSQAVLFTNTVPSHIRGAVVGLDAAMDQLLAVAAPFIAGFLISIFNIQTTLLIFMLLYFVSLLVAVVVYWKFIAKPPKPNPA